MRPEISATRVFEGAIESIVDSFMMQYGGAIIVVGNDCGAALPRNDNGTSDMTKVTKTDEEWQVQLSRLEFHITRRAGTEPAFSGVYWDTKTPGIYRCKCCDTPLFDSDTKYDSGSGWPSFYTPIARGAVVTREENSHFMRRTEVLCAACEAHLGHVFPDGPDPTGLRFCMNSASLNLEEPDSK